MKLLLDVGNTRLKWALADAAGIGELSAVPHDGHPAHGVADLPGDAVTAIRVASVCGPAPDAELAAALAARFGVRPLFAATRAELDGLRIAYAEPERLGVDRWLAMLGAWCRLRRAFCLVSAGTALTFDAVDDQGRHLGGLIGPGLRAMVEATLGCTRFATLDLPEAPEPALGRDTEACVAGGALYAALGLIERAARDAPPTRLICGGDAARLKPMLTGHWQEQPDAVFQGLLRLPD